MRQGTVPIHGVGQEAKVLASPHPPPPLRQRSDKSKSGEGVAAVSGRATAPVCLALRWTCGSPQGTNPTPLPPPRTRRGGVRNAAPRKRASPQGGVTPSGRSKPPPPRSPDATEATAPRGPAVRTAEQTLAHCHAPLRAVTRQLALFAGAIVLPLWMFDRRDAEQHRAGVGGAALSARLGQWPCAL